MARVGQPSGNTPPVQALPDTPQTHEAPSQPVAAASGVHAPQEHTGYWSGEAESPDDDDLVGTTLSNTYKVLRVLGEGGMGRVYEAQHTRINGKRFALKALHPEFARNKDVLARFQREVEAAAAINNQHVVGVYDVDQTAEGRPFLVSELLEGMDLGDYLEATPRLSVGFAIRIVRQICRALIAAHEKGVVHRDMKPENVFLTGNLTCPAVKVLDFGISRLEGQKGNTLTKTGFIMGTPSYMAPEQAKGARVDHRADVYAVGAILYQCVTGRIPFDRADATATLAAVLTEEPERPRSIVPDLPEHIEMIIQRAMAHEPDARFQSMAELDLSLAPYDESDMVLDEPSTTMGVRLTQMSLVDASEQAHEVADARPRLLLVCGLLILSVLFGLVGAIGGAMRLFRGGTTPTISGTEALVLGLVLLAALSTPLVLVIRHVKTTVWDNTAKVLETLHVLRVPLTVGLGSYGMLAITLRLLETALLRSPIGIAWAAWDLLLPVMAAGAGMIAHFGRRKSAEGSTLLQRVGTATTISVGAAAALAIVVAVGVAQPSMVSSEATSEADDDSAETDEGAEETNDQDVPRSTESAIPLVGDAAFSQWDKVLGDLKVGNLTGAVKHLETLLELDKNAPRDPNVRKGIVKLMVRTCLAKGATCDKMVSLVSERMGQSGIDVLYAVYTTKGGTGAWRQADRLLRNPDIRKRGSAALNIAYDLRTAPSCDAKKALFEDVRTHGDYRALRELEILKSKARCKSMGCCLNSNDDELRVTIRALLDKQ